MLLEQWDSDWVKVNLFLEDGSEFACKCTSIEFMYPKNKGDRCMCSDCHATYEINPKWVNTPST